MTDRFDIVVIGAGPGGYVAAIRAAQLGFKVGVVEKNALGGTCLNVGCIPSKALLDSSELYHQVNHSAAIHGIDVSSVKLNLKQMFARKNEVVDATVKGIDYLMTKNKIPVFKGVASFVDANTLSVDDSGTKTTVQSDKFIIATGSEPTPLPPVPFDGKRIISSTEALSMKELPKHLIVVGGGVIGVEMGSIFARLGSKVTVVEYFDRVIPTMDKELGKGLQKSLKKIGFEFKLKTKVTGVSTSKSKVTLSAEDSSGLSLSIEGDYVLVAIGRRPYTENLNLEAAGVKLTDRGQVEINESFQTSVPNIYAIGDVVRGAMLAHKASEEGVVCVEKIAGMKPHLNYHTIPGVVYTWPEVASVGYTEEQLGEKGIVYKSGKFPFKASGRARAAEESEGFVKILADASTDEVLGIHMMGPRCADLIAEALVAMEYRASAEDIAALCHPHPTYSEAVKEAALDCTDSRSVHQ